MYVGTTVGGGVNYPRRYLRLYSAPTKEITTATPTDTNTETFH